MSNGITHSKLTIIITLPFSIGIGIIIFPFIGINGTLLAIISFFIGFMISLWINPDTDQFGIVTSEWWIIKKFSIIGWILVGLFDPYSRIIPRHRHWLSHFPVIGTLFRIMYIIFLLLILSLFIPLVKEFSLFIFYNWDILLYFAISMGISDFFHYMLDFNNSFRKWFEKFINK